MDNKKISEIVGLRYSKMKDLMDPIFEAKQVNRALYSQEYHPPTDESDYALSDPQVFPVVRNYLARTNPSKTGIRLDPRNANEYENRDINQALLNWELSKIYLTSLLYRIFYGVYLDGKSYYKTGWKYQPAITVEEKDEFGNITRQKIIREITNRADAQYVRFEDILVPNMNIPILREQPYYIELIQQRVGDMLDENESLLEMGQEAYWDEKWLKKLREKGVDKKLLDYQADFVDDSEISKDDLAFKAAYVPMMCMHTKEGDVFYVPFSGNEASEQVVNTNKENRYWHNHYPVADFAAFPEDDNFIPQSLVDVIADLQISSSELLNLGLSNIRQGTFQMWIAGTPAAQTPDWMFRTRPDGVVRVVGDPNQIAPVRVTDNSRSTMNMAQEVSTRIEKSSGVSSLYASGAGGNQINQTARGAQIIDQNIDTNTKMIMDLFGEQVIKVMAEDFLELNAQYITEDQTFSITGKKGVKDLVTITPDKVSANFNVEVNAERMIKQTPASRQASLQNTITVLQNIQNQSQGAVQVDLTPIVEALIDATPEMENVNDVVISIDEKGKRDIAMLERGQMPEIKVRDPHLDLIQLVSLHGEEMQYTPEIEALFNAYIEKHMKFLTSKQEVQQTMNLMNQAQQLGQGGEQLNSDQAGTPGQGYALGNITPNGA